MKYKRLGDVLIEMGLITSEQLTQALELQKETKQRLGRVLISNGFITENELMNALEAQLGIDFIDLNKEVIDPSLTAYIPKELAQSAQILPVRLQKNTLYIAMADPMNFMAAEQAKDVSKKRIIPLFANSEAVRRTIEELYADTGSIAEISEMEDMPLSETDGSPVEGADVQESAVSTSTDPGAHLVHRILERAAGEGCEELYLEPDGTGIAVWMCGNGQTRKVMTLPERQCESAPAYLKSLCRLDSSEKRLPQSGSTALRLKEYHLWLQVHTLPAADGERLAVKVLQRGRSIPDRTSIGMSTKQQKQLDQLMKAQSGLLILTGPAGSGKTTTMYSLLKACANGRKTVVAEQETTYLLSGIIQTQCNEREGLSMAHYMEAALSMRPEILCIDEITDSAAAAAAIQAAMTDHLVIATVQAGSAAHALERLKCMGITGRTLAGCLLGIVNQKLVRRVCGMCAETYTWSMEDSDVQAVIQTAAKQKHWQHGAGCSACDQSGYQGRQGIYEIISASGEFRRGILDTADPVLLQEHMNQVLAEACLWRQAAVLAGEGIIAPDEAARLVHLDNSIAIDI